MNPTRGSWMIGGVVGVVGALVAMGIGAIGMFVCCLPMVNWFLPALMGLVAGGLAASRVDWSQVPSGNGSSVGIGAGWRAGLVASMLTAAGALLMSLLSPVVVVAIQLIQAGSTEELVGAMIGALIGGMIGLAIAAAIQLGNVIFGALLGAGGGAIVGSSMGNAGS